MFLDISKAFDKVWHKSILYKNISCHKWPRVRLAKNFCFSPSRFCLGSLLFLVYINNITSVVNYCNIRLSADDTCLFVSTNNHTEAAMFINQDLNHIEEWAKQWIVKFSPSKTESMVLSLKTKSNKLFPRLFLCNTPIAKCAIPQAHWTMDFE